MASVVPSLPAASFAELNTLADALSGIAPELQVDIVDGQFVPAISWPFTERDPVAALQQLQSICTQFSVGMDCMVMEPRQYLDHFAELGVERVIVHIGSTEQFVETIAAGHTHGFRMGVAFTNDISLFDVEECLRVVDFVQIMGIKNVGKQGEPFDERALTTAKTLREAHPDLEIAVDGHVNKTTIPLLMDAGADRFAPGSAIAKQDDPRAAYEEIVALVSGVQL